MEGIMKEMKEHNEENPNVNEEKENNQEEEEKDEQDKRKKELVNTARRVKTRTFCAQNKATKNIKKTGVTEEKDEQQEQEGDLGPCSMRMSIEKKQQQMKKKKEIKIS